MSNITKFVQKLSEFADKTAIINAGIKTTYTNLADEIFIFNKKLIDLDIKKGQVVFILGDYSVESISLFFNK